MPSHLHALIVRSDVQKWNCAGPRHLLKKVRKAYLNAHLANVVGKNWINHRAHSINMENL